MRTSAERKESRDAEVEEVHRYTGFLKDTFRNVRSEPYDNQVQKAPFYVMVNEDFLGGLKAPEHNPDVLWLIQKAYEIGIIDGKMKRSKEISDLL